MKKLLPDVDSAPGHQQAAAASKHNSYWFEYSDPTKDLMITFRAPILAPNHNLATNEYSTEIVKPILRVSFILKKK